MDVANKKNTEETYSQYHKDTLIEEYLQKRTTVEEEKILIIELEKRGISLGKVQQFVEENKLDVYSNGLTYANLALRENRVMAYLIDSYYIICTFIVLSVIVGIVGIDYGIAAGISTLAYCLYFLIKDALPNGQSFGKKTMKIKVVSSKTAKNCTIPQSIIRNIVNLIPFINIADAIFAGRYQRQRMGDILAGTIVIDDVSKEGNNMNEYEKNLKENYANMHDDMLLNLLENKELTQEAKILLNEEMNRRAITRDSTKLKNADVLDEKKNDLDGIKGWLILVGIGIVFSPIRLGFTLIQTFTPMMKDGSWEKATTVGSLDYVPNFQALIITEISFNLCVMIASIYLIYLFTKKSEDFPKLFILIGIISTLAIPLDSYLTTLVFNEMEVFDKETLKEFMKAVLGYFIWIPYMLISERVKHTFIH